MRIVHVLLRYPPATGGAERYAHDIVTHTRSVPEKGDVRVLTSRLRTHGPLSLLDPNLLVDDPIYVQRLHHSATPFVSYPRLQALQYYLGHHAPDMIHAYGFWYQPADSAARYATKYHIPFIFHPIYYENAIRRKWPWQLYKKTIGRKTFEAADVVVVISPFEQSLIEQAGLPVKRFALIPPGIDLENYARPRPNPFITRAIIGPVLVAVSRIAASKGIDTLIAALPDIIKLQPDVQLVIAGEDFGAKKALKKQAEALGVTKHVHWLGKLNDEELKGAYQHADIFVHGSHYEAFGIAVAEALACGTPVIARNIAAIPYVVPNHQAGLLFDSHDDLVKAVTTLLADQSLRQRFGEAGKKYIAKNFSWEILKPRILKLYDEFGK